MRARSLSVDSASLASDAVELADQFNAFQYAGNGSGGGPPEATDFRRKKSAGPTTAGANASTSVIGPNGEHIKHIGGELDGIEMRCFFLLLVKGHTGLIISTILSDFRINDVYIYDYVVLLIDPSFHFVRLSVSSDVVSRDLICALRLFACQRCFFICICLNALVKTTTTTSTTTTT